jgi:hypothetical protein
MRARELLHQKATNHVKRPVNPQLTPWEVVRKIPRGTKHFAVFDALKGYHQVELDEESRALTTFMTPFGRYRYLRLPFGLNSAGEEFTLRYGRAVDDSVQGCRITEDTVLLGQTTRTSCSRTHINFSERVIRTGSR